MFSEAGDGPGASREVLLFARDPSLEGEPPIRLGYWPPEEYRITDAAQLPDGRLLVLNQFFSPIEGVSVILSRVDLDALQEVAILSGTPVARFDPPMTVDNIVPAGAGPFENSADIAIGTRKGSLDNGLSRTEVYDDPRQADVAVIVDDRVVKTKLLLEGASVRFGYQHGTAFPRAGECIVLGIRPVCARQQLQGESGAKHCVRRPVCSRLRA